MESMEDVFRHESEARGKKLLELTQDIKMLEVFFNEHINDIDLSSWENQAIKNLIQFIREQEK